MSVALKAKIAEVFEEPGRYQLMALKVRIPAPWGNDGETLGAVTLSGG